MGYGGAIWLIFQDFYSTFNIFDFHINLRHPVAALSERTKKSFFFLKIEIFAIFFKKIDNFRFSKSAKTLYTCCLVITKHVGCHDSVYMTRCNSLNRVAILKFSEKLQKMPKSFLGQIAACS